MFSAASTCILSLTILGIFHADDHQIYTKDKYQQKVKGRLEDSGCSFIISGGRYIIS